MGITFYEIHEYPNDWREFKDDPIHDDLEGDDWTVQKVVRSVTKVLSWIAEDFEVSRYWVFDCHGDPCPEDDAARAHSMAFQIKRKEG